MAPIAAQSLAVLWAAHSVSSPSSDWPCSSCGDENAQRVPKILPFRRWRRTSPPESSHRLSQLVSVSHDRSFQIKQRTDQRSSVPPTYFWDVNAPSQQTWAHSGPEVSGEDSKDSPRSTFTELHSKSSLARIAELPGAPAAKEMGTLEVTPKPSQTGFGSNMAKTPTLGVVPEPKNSTEKH